MCRWTKPEPGIAGWTSSEPGIARRTGYAPGFAERPGDRPGPSKGWKPSRESPIGQRVNPNAPAPHQHAKGLQAVAMMAKPAGLCSCERHAALGLKCNGPGRNRNSAHAGHRARVNYHGSSDRSRSRAPRDPCWAAATGNPAAAHLMRASRSARRRGAHCAGASAGHVSRRHVGRARIDRTRTGQTRYLRRRLATTIPPTTSTAPMATTGMIASSASSPVWTRLPLGLLPGF